MVCGWSCLAKNRQGGCGWCIQYSYISSILEFAEADLINATLWVLIIWASDTARVPVSLPLILLLHLEKGLPASVCRLSGNARSSQQFTIGTKHAATND